MQGAFHVDLRQGKTAQKSSLLEFSVSLGISGTVVEFKYVRFKSREDLGVRGEASSVLLEAHMYHGEL